MYLPFRLSLYSAHCIFVDSQIHLCGWFCLFEGKWSESEHETHFMLGSIRPFCSDTVKISCHLLFALYWGFFGGFGQV